MLTSTVHPKIDRKYDIRLVLWAKDVQTAEQWYPARATGILRCVTLSTTSPNADPAAPKAPSDPSDPSGYAFHRLNRISPNYRWWRPLIVGLVAIGIYLALFLTALFAAIIVGLVFAEADSWLDESANPFEAIDLNDPVTFVGLMISLILMLPALGLANFFLGFRPAGMLSSVAGRLRWRWFARCVGIAAIVCSGGFLVSLGAQAVSGQPTMAAPVNPDLALMLILVVLLVPFQAAAEEYVFRGYLMQTIGARLRHPAFAIALPVPLFILGHDYELLGMIDVGIFALAAGWLSWRTGGLEAAVALHIVNNMLVFALGMWGFIDVNASDTTIAGLAISLVMTAAFVFAVVRDSNRFEIARTRPPLFSNSQ